MSFSLFHLSRFPLLHLFFPVCPRFHFVIFVLFVISSVSSFVPLIYRVIRSVLFVIYIFLRFIMSLVGSFTLFRSSSVTSRHSLIIFRIKQCAIWPKRRLSRSRNLLKLRSIFELWDIRGQRIKVFSRLRHERRPWNAMRARPFFRAWSVCFLGIKDLSRRPLNAQSVKISVFHQEFHVKTLKPRSQCATKSRRRKYHFQTN